MQIGVSKVLDFTLMSSLIPNFSKIFVVRGKVVFVMIGFAYSNKIDNFIPYKFALF